jgi:hypothetical protein
MHMVRPHVERQQRPGSVAADLEDRVVHEAPRGGGENERLIVQDGPSEGSPTWVGCNCGRAGGAGTSVLDRAARIAVEACGVGVEREEVRTSGGVHSSQSGVGRGELRPFRPLSRLRRSRRPAR